MSDQSEPIKTIHDVARVSGVSIGTVSRVFNGHQAVAESTRQRVLDVARRSRFKPQGAARRTNIALVSDFKGYGAIGGYGTSLLAHLISDLMHRDVSVSIHGPHQLDELSQRLIDGIIVIPWADDVLDKVASRTTTPLVAVNDASNTKVSSITTDHREGGRLVGEAFALAGHKKTAYISIDRNYGNGERLKGMGEGLRAVVPDACIVEFFTSEHSLAPAIRRSLDSGATALFVGSEDLVMESWNILSLVLRKSIPDDVSIVTIDNGMISPYLDPPLTGLVHPIADLARGALDQVFQNIRGDVVSPRVFSEYLIDRGSVAAPFHTKERHAI